MFQSYELNFCPIKTKVWKAAIDFNSKNIHRLINILINNKNKYKAFSFLKLLR